MAGLSVLRRGGAYECRTRRDTEDRAGQNETSLGSARWVMLSRSMISRSTF